MNEILLNTINQHFINTHLESDIGSLMLKKLDGYTGDKKALIAQIESKKKCQTKLPTWYDTKNIYYPNKLNIEQTSSEITAQYKASLMGGHTLIDITGGFGVDTYYFSKQFDTVTHCEINASLSEIVKHNYTQLKVSNIHAITGDGIAYLQKSDTLYDCIYVDPSRRHDTKGKVFYLNDCVPNIPEHLDLLLAKAQTVLIKASPMLDISAGIKDLGCVKEIHVVAVNNDVKEVLFLLDRNDSAVIQIKTINFTKTKAQRFDFKLADEVLPPALSLPKRYLYESNRAIMKSGAFNAVARQLQLDKLHVNSHLYTSEQRMAFPGRTFVIDKVIPYHKKTILKEGLKKANITTRNFPLSVKELRQKFHIKDGGDCYLFFTTTMDEQKIMIKTKQLMTAS